MTIEFTATRTAAPIAPRRHTGFVARTGLAALVSPDAGVVHRVDDGMTRWDHPRLAPAYTALADTRPTLGVEVDARPGGMATELVAARLAAAGEAVERYSAAHVPTSRLRVGTRADLGARHVAEPVWSDAASDRPPIHWLPAQLLSAVGPSRPAWVAASRALLVELDPDAPLLPSTSSGLACHDDPWQAMASGLAEVIERDAFMYTWLTRGPVTPLQGSLNWTSPAGARILLDRAIESYRLFLLPSPGDVPVVLAVAFGAEGQPAAAVGAAAALDLVDACRRAVVEAYQTLHWAIHLLTDGVLAPALDAPLSTFDDHVAYYLGRDRLAAFDFLLDGSRTATPIEVDLDRAAPARSARSRVREMVARLDVAGFETFAADVTSPDVRAAGLWVVRAVVPGLVPLSIGAAIRPLGCRIPVDAALNPDPHPFP